MFKTFLKAARAAAAVPAVVMFGFMVVPMLSGIVNIGAVAGAVLSVWIFCVSAAPVHRAIRKAMKKRLSTKILYRAVNICFIAFAVYGAVVTGFMAYCAAQAPAEGATAVVLGAQVKSWGPSVILQGRIDAAENYLADNPDSYAVLSGGRGEDEPTSEAQSMYDTMTADGILPSRLYIEDNSESTVENLEYSMQIIEQNNLSTDIAVVTDGFHQLRARIIAWKLDIEGSIGAVNADTSLMYMPVYIVREWFAVPYELFFR